MVCLATVTLTVCTLPAYVTLLKLPDFSETVKVNVPSWDSSIGLKVTDEPLFETVWIVRPSCFSSKEKALRYSLELMSAPVRVFVADNSRTAGTVSVACCVWVVCCELLDPDPEPEPEPHNQSQKLEANACCGSVNAINAATAIAMNASSPLLFACAIMILPSTTPNMQNQASRLALLLTHKGARANTPVLLRTSSAVTFGKRLLPVSKGVPIIPFLHT